MRVIAIFPDGAMYSAPTHVALEDCLMADVWNPSDPKAFRREMARRADVWSGWYLNPESRSEAFLRGMEKAGMLRLEVEK
jgi:hypothetical protein